MSGGLDGECKREQFESRERGWEVGSEREKWGERDERKYEIGDGVQHKHLPAIDDIDQIAANDYDQNQLVSLHRQRKSLLRLI